MYFHSNSSVSAGLFAAMMLTGCQVSPPPGTASTASLGSTVRSAPRSAQSNSDENSENVLLTVHGMSCPLCATNVDKQLLKVPGVEDVKVNLSTGKIRVRVSKQQPPTSEDLINAVRESGFTLVGQPQYP